MWGSLQLDWPFSLVVVVVITITSRSHRSPSTDDCKYSTPACVSVCLSTVVGSLLYVAAIYPCFLPHIAPSPLSQPRLSELSHLSVLRSLSSFSSLTLSLFLRRQKHGAFLTGSDRSHFPLPPPPSTISTNQCPPPSSAVSSSWTLSSNRKWCSSLAPGVALFSSHALCPFYWDSGGVTLISRWLGIWCPAPPHPLSLLLNLSPPPTVPTCSHLFEMCPAPILPTAQLWVCCLHPVYFNTAVLSQYTVQHRTVLYVSADLSCWSVLVWFHVLLLLWWF